MPELHYNDPFQWFDAWFSEASQTDIADPNAMTVATANEAGMLSVRVVLLKEWDNRGFVFYTNLMSHKGHDLAHNPNIGANFFWRTLSRQIRIEGKAEQISDAQADAYFASRDRGSQIGAWASQQSAPLDSRQTLIDRVGSFTEKYGDSDVPRPDHWSGLRIVPTAFEFWESGDYRLHDRWRFEKDGADWKGQRLYP